jgi:hypothetical protein
MASLSLLTFEAIRHQGDGNAEVSAGRHVAFYFGNNMEGFRGVNLLMP